MERRFVQGKTSKEQFDAVESTLQSFQRRLGQKVVGIIPPVPIFHTARIADSDGRLFSGIMPFAGTIHTLCVYIGSYSNKTATLEVSLIRSEGMSRTQIFECRRRTQIFHPDYPVEVGDVFRVRELEPNSIADFMLGIALHVAMADSDKMNQLLDQLNQLERKEDASENP